MLKFEQTFEFTLILRIFRHFNIIKIVTHLEVLPKSGRNSGHVQNSGDYGTASLSVLLTFSKVLRYWYLPLCTLSHVVTLYDSTGTTIYTGDWYCLFFQCKYMHSYSIFNPFFLFHDPENWGSVKLVVTSESVMQLNSQLGQFFSGTVLQLRKHR